MVGILRYATNLAAMAAMFTRPLYPTYFDVGRGTKRVKPGTTYPHSSDRQRARYARQIKAGQLSMAGIANQGGVMKDGDLK